MSEAFISVLINALCHNHVEWSRIVKWLDIDERAFKSALLNSAAADFVENEREWYKFTSTQLAFYILNNFDFDTEVIVHVYSKIVTETAYSSEGGPYGTNSYENLKKLLKFRFLTTLLSDRTDMNQAIISVYRRLSKVNKIRGNDQFYLQYAMAMMENGELGKAETYLDNALSIATSKKFGNSIRQIKDQRIRLFFQKNTISSRYSWLEVHQAIKDLQESLTSRLDFPIHPLRSAELIENFLEKWIDEMSVENISEFTGILTLMREKMPDRGRLEKSRGGETEDIRGQLFSIGVMLSNA